MKSIRTSAGTLCLFAFTCVSHVSAQTPADSIARANQAYQGGHFHEAINLYQSAAQAGETSAALFYNLGNACFRAGDFGHAILNYERALALKPQHPEAEANLRLARDKARALELRPRWWNEFIGRASPNAYAIAAAVSAWLAIFGFAIWLAARRRSIPLLFLSLLAFVCAGASVAALFALETGRNGPSLAVVPGKNIEARVATADNAGSVLILPAGSEIKILSTRGDWIYAALPNDLRGWIPAGSAERVRL
jgi:tetratricopeptide (TPR) repeat protein